MDILFTIHHGLSRNAGAPGVTVKLAQALRERGHDVRIYSHDDVKGVAGRARTMLFPWFVLWHVILHPGYDVLDMSSGDGWLVYLARRSLGWRRRQLAVTRSHGMEPVVHQVFLEGWRTGNAQKSWKYGFYYGGLRLWECTKSFEWADVAMLLNDTECSYATKELGFDAQRVVQIDNGIDELFTSVAKNALAADDGVAGTPFNLAFIGRANYWKGIGAMEEVVPALFDRNPQLTLTLFGTGEPAGRTLERFPEPLRSRIVAVPRYDNERMPEMLKRCHILMFPSVYEGFPLSPLEAMACGLVPVVTDIGGLRAVVRDGVNGLVVPCGDAAALDAAVQSLLDDPARWAALRRRARERALEYAWSKIAARFERLYVSRLGRGFVPVNE